MVVIQNQLTFATEFNKRLTNQDLFTKTRRFMKKMILTAVVLLSSVATFAQRAVGTVSLKPQVGVVGATMTEFEKTKMKVGFTAGAELEYQVSDIFSLSGGVMYAQEGVKFDTGADFKIGNMKFEVKDAKTNLAYINVPIMANVYVVPGLAVKLGVQPAFAVDKDGTKAKSFDLAIPVGLSYEFANVVIDGRYNWGVTKVFDNIDAKNSVFQVTLGYKFDL
jgi:hypothetical protein